MMVALLRWIIWSVLSVLLRSLSSTAGMRIRGRRTSDSMRNNRKQT